MSALDTELAAYKEGTEQLERSHHGKWVIFKGSSLIGIHETFEEAAGEAVRRYGRGPYLIHQVGAPPIVMPASISYHPPHEDH